MKSTALLIVCGFAFTAICHAQFGDPVRFDQMTEPNCETFLARLDNLLVRLNSAPADHAFVVIKGDNRKLLRKLRYEMWLKGTVQFKRFDLSRISIIRAEEDGRDVDIDFWVEPPDADFRPSVDHRWSFKLDARTKPMLIYDEMEQICTSVGAESVVKEFLDANDLASARITIFAKGSKAFNRVVRQVRAKMKGIPGERLRFVWQKSLSEYKRYWIVLPRK